MARLPGGDIAYIEAGEGPGHCAAARHRLGRALLVRAGRCALAYCRVIAWNAPGYPPSSPLEANSPSARIMPPGWKRCSTLCGVSICHLVGHSLGCLIAARFARLHPARVRSLTLASCAIGHARLDPQERARLLDAPHRRRARPGAARHGRKAGPRLLGPHASPQAQAAVMETMAGVDPAGYAQAARMLSGRRSSQRHQAIAPQVPLQFAYGDADVITPPEVNLRAAAARPGAPVTASRVRATRVTWSSPTRSPPFSKTSRGNMPRTRDGANPDDPRERYVVPALAHGLDVLALFSRERQSLTAPEICEALQLPRASVFRLLVTLEPPAMCSAAPTSARFGSAPACSIAGLRILPRLICRRSGCRRCSDCVTAPACRRTWPFVMGARSSMSRASRR